MRFVEALRSAGLCPPDAVYPDGKIHRCDTESKRGRKNGWYILHPDGRGYFGDWAVGGGEKLGEWRDEAAHIRPTPPRVVEQMRRQRELERQQRVRAIRSVRRAWALASSMAGLHPYLRAKGLTRAGCNQLRESGHLLLVPMYVGDSLVNVQTIDPGGRKLFQRGAPTRGAALVIEARMWATTVVVEGLATGLAVFQSVPFARIVVAFNAGNIARVMERMRPTGAVVIAADNDWETAHRTGRNPGLDAATTAAATCGAGVAAPECTGTDWADALQEWGNGAANRIRREILAKARFVDGVGPSG